MFLSHYFAPEVGAAQARILALAQGLQARGVDVTVHTGVPHYPSGRVPSGYRNRPFSRDEVGGVPVVRSLTYPVPNAGFAKRIANHAVLAASTLLTTRTAGPADVIVAESPPLFMAASGALQALARRVPLALNISDRWPASAVELGALTQPQAVAAAEALEHFCYRRAAAICAPTRGIVEAIDVLPSARGKVHHVPPAVDVERWAAVPDLVPHGGPLRVLYAGTLGLAQGMDTLVEAARLAGPDTVHLRVAGDGPDRELVQQAGLPNVEVLPAVAAHEVPALYAEADVGVVPLRDRPIFAGALPTKLFEIMASGRASLLSAPAGEASGLLAEHACGVAVAPEDPRALAQALRDLHAAPDRVAALAGAGRAAAQHYARGRAVDRWEELLRTLAARRSWPAPAGRRPAG